EWVRSSRARPRGVQRSVEGPHRPLEEHRDLELDPGLLRPGPQREAAATDRPLDRAPRDVPDPSRRVTAQARPALDGDTGRRRREPEALVESNARAVVALGASAGGVDALSRILSDFPADLGAAVLVVLHTAAGYESRLPEVLGRHSPLPTAHAT